MEREAAPDQLKLDEATAREFYDKSIQAIDKPTTDEDYLLIDGTAEFPEQLEVFIKHAAHLE